MSQQIQGNERDSMERRRVAMSDGRYMFYYTFGSAALSDDGGGTEAQSIESADEGAAGFTNSNAISDARSKDDSEGSDV